MPRKAPEDYDCFIYKRDLRRFFVDLRKQAHYIYALLEGAPKSVFWIVLENEDSDADEQTFTVKEFYANVAKFHHRKDTFRLYFEAYFFRNEWDSCVDGWRFMDNPFNGETKYEVFDPDELCVENFEKEWLHLLAYLCRKQILANAPFRLDRETIRQYKFSREDVKLLREPAARCNERIIAELRAQYDRLAVIDCLHETPKKKQEPKFKPAPVKTERAPRARTVRRVPMLNG